MSNATSIGRVVWKNGLMEITKCLLMVERAHSLQLAPATSVPLNSHWFTSIMHQQQTGHVMWQHDLHTVASTQQQATRQCYWCWEHNRAVLLSLILRCGLKNHRFGAQKIIVSTITYLMLHLWRIQMHPSTNFKVTLCSLAGYWTTLVMSYKTGSHNHCILYK